MSIKKRAVLAIGLAATAFAAAFGQIPVAAAQSAAHAVDLAALPRDLSPWGMVAGAGIVVQLVMAGLALASVVTWTILLAKGIELIVSRRRLAAARARIEAAGSLDEVAAALSGERNVAAALVAAALRELAMSGDIGDDGINERTRSRFERIAATAGRTMSRGTGWLATIGATAPFVGLFGTVWGIMDAFIGISRAQTTNLAVVAPGIAAALLTTAAGLFTAIPAVVIYNAFARGIGGYRATIADAATGILRLLSRDLDLRRAPLSDTAE